MHDFYFPPGPSFSERHPLYQYPLTLFGFVGVHSSKKGGLRGEQNLTDVFCQVPGKLHGKQRSWLRQADRTDMVGNGRDAQVRERGQVEYV